MTRLAVNLMDLDRLSDIERQRMLVGRVDLGHIIRVELDLQRRKLDPAEPAVELTCRLIEAAMICDILRNNDRRAGRDQTRLYVNRGSSWVPIDNRVVLTVRLVESVHLNPTFFPNIVLPIKDEHEAPEPFTFGR